MRKHDSKLMGAGVALGLGIGTALGVDIHNIGAGIAAGVPIGVAIGFAFNKRRTIKQEELNWKF